MRRTADLLEGTPYDGGRSLAPFLLALMLHASALLALTSWRSADELEPPGEQEITIDLAPAMQEAETVEPAEVAQPLQTETEIVEPEPESVTAETVPPKQTTEDVPFETAESVAPETPTVTAEALAAETLDPEEVTAVAPEETVTAEIPPEPPNKAKPERREPKPERRERPRPRVAEKPAAAPPSNPRQGRASSSRENMAASAASADPNARARYVAQISAAVRSRLRYPSGARSQGMSGVATVRFTLNRSGAVLGAALVRSTGHSALDQAALAAVRPGSAFPPAPDGVPQQQITFVVPLRFSLQ